MLLSVALQQHHDWVSPLLLDDWLCEGWWKVLWIDADVHQYSSNIIQTMLSVCSRVAALVQGGCCSRVAAQGYLQVRKSIVVPNVVMPVPSRRSYDLNSWRLPPAQQGMPRALHCQS